MLSRKSKILIADDEVENQNLLKLILENSREYQADCVGDGLAVLDYVKNTIPDLILLDINMPKMNGINTAINLKNNPNTRDIPIIFITGLNELDLKIKAFEIGGVDYITKPFELLEVLSRINTHIRLKMLKDNLEAEIAKRTTELERLNFILVSALEDVNYYNDDDTGIHIRRVSHYSKLIAQECTISSDRVNEIFRYASLHDIGKVGIPDDILKKPGRLANNEFEQMKSHCEIGYKMIDYPEFSQVAKNIILYHHEKWNGEGYPKGLKGEEIPLEARIVAIADVYDALRSQRPYKDPFSAEEAYSIIMDLKGSHFDPDIVDIFNRKYKEISSIFDSFGDTVAENKHRNNNVALNVS